jgi:hypothetical protein
MQSVLGRVEELMAVLRWLLLMCALTGCAGLEPGRLPTAEEQCAYQSGVWSPGGICFPKGGGAQ